LLLHLPLPNLSTSSKPYPIQALGTHPNLPGDAFDLVVLTKTALELACPNTVSCSDILAVATRDLVTMVGGPFYNIPLGRLDYHVKSSAEICTTTRGAATIRDSRWRCRRRVRIPRRRSGCRDAAAFL
ncbi:Peroxidase 63, partial [Linum perenne]